MRFSSLPASRRASLYCACFLIGIAGNAYAARSVPMVIFIVVILIAVSVRRSLAFSCLAFLIGGCLFCSFTRERYRTEFANGTSLQFTGIVVEPPDIRHDKIFLTIIPDHTMIQRGNRSGRILVSAPRYPVWGYGDRISLSGTIQRPEAFSGFNYPLYLERYRIYGLLPAPKPIHLLERDTANPLLATLYRFRGRLEQTIRDRLPEPTSSFLGGILLGSKRSIPDSVQADLRKTGTSHIIAISGANITILLGILLTILPIYTAKKRFFATVVIGLFITLLTGASASVMRGAIVAIAACYLRMRGRIAWATPFLLFSAALLLLGNPLLIADPGFQLSFGAFAGIAYLSTPLLRIGERWRLTAWLPEIIRTPLAETTAATIGTAPLSLLIFHQFSLLGLIVNPLILWLISPITLLGLAELVCSPVPIIGMALSLPLWILLRTVLSIISTFSKIPFGIVSIPV